MARLLLLVVLVFAAYLVVRSLTGGRAKGRDANVDRSKPDPSTTELQSMRQCAWCGAHVPVGDALLLPDGRLYCSTAHRDAAATASRDASASSSSDRPRG